MPPGGGDSPSSGATITSVFFLMSVVGIPSIFRALGCVLAERGVVSVAAQPWITTPLSSVKSHSQESDDCRCRH